MFFKDLKNSFITPGTKQYWEDVELFWYKIRPINKGWDELNSHQRDQAERDYNFYLKAAKKRPAQ